MPLDAAWVDHAIELVPKIVDGFGRSDGSFDDSVASGLVLRTRKTSNCAVLSGSWRMNLALSRLARITGKLADLERARRPLSISTGTPRIEFDSVALMGQLERL